MSYAGTLSSNPLIQLKSSPKFRAKKRSTKFSAVSARLDNSKANSTDPQLNLSVLRFTLGIPGLDESYLPRWIGYGFGSLLLLNHFAGSVSPTLAQLRTEALGLSLAAFSITLPYLGKFLKGATPMDQTSIPQECEQIFVISEEVSNTQKEDLAWATYISLRNTNTISVVHGRESKLNSKLAEREEISTNLDEKVTCVLMISVRDKLCVRGYWSIPDDVSKTKVLDWFVKQIKSIGLSDVKETLYLPQIQDSGLWEMVPKGTRSLLVQPILHPSDNGIEKAEGFVLLASSMRYAYSDKDRAWTGALTNKFRGK